MERRIVVAVRRRALGALVVFGATDRTVGMVPNDDRARRPDFSRGRTMYEKPHLQRFGSLRELTLIGLGPNGDGGIWGLGWIDGRPPNDTARS